MSKVLFVFAVVVAGCGGKSQPAAGDQPPAPLTNAAAAPIPMTPEECTAKGGQVKGDIGDGKIACDAGQRELGRVGIEGAVCCEKTGADVAAKVTEFKNAMCACKNKVCVDNLLVDMERWSRENPKAAEGVRGDPQMTKIGEELGKCAAVAMGAGLPP
jgi:hypothetical protein